MQGMYEGRRYQGRPARIWFDYIKDWTGLDGQVAYHRTENREDWRRLSYAAAKLLFRRHSVYR